MRSHAAIGHRRAAAIGQPDRSRPDPIILCICYLLPSLSYLLMLTT